MRKKNWPRCSGTGRVGFNRDERLQHPGFLLRRGQDRRRVTGSALRGRRCESVKFRHLFTRENTLPKGSEDDHERRAEVIRSLQFCLAHRKPVLGLAQLLKSKAAQIDVCCLLHVDAAHYLHRGKEVFVEPITGEADLGSRIRGVFHLLGDGCEAYGIPERLYSERLNRRGPFPIAFTLFPSFSVLPLLVFLAIAPFPFRALKLELSLQAAAHPGSGRPSHNRSTNDAADQSDHATDRI